MHHYGTYGSSNVMVMDLLGASLEDLFTRCGRRFSLKTTLKLADQLLERVDAIHSRHLIHRDIKPANFVMESDTSELVFCIDFGLSKRFRNPHTLAHIPHRVGKSLTGTPRYASINNHLGIEQARRDDLEAIGYVLIYFLKGRLPWQGLKARNASRKYKMIMEKKQSTSINTLCAGCPKEFAEYLSYCRSLKFEASPNIKYLRQLFQDLYVQQGYPLNTYGDNDWDWHRVPEGAASGGGSGGGAHAATNGGSGGDGGGAGRPPVNSKPYGMYGGAGGDNPRPGSAGYRPQTAATGAAHAGSVGDTRPDSAAPTGRYTSGGGGGGNDAGSGAAGSGSGPRSGRLPEPSGSSGQQNRAGTSKQPAQGSSRRGGPESAPGQATGGMYGGAAAALPADPSGSAPRAWPAGGGGSASGGNGSSGRRPQSAKGSRSGDAAKAGGSSSGGGGAVAPTGGQMGPDGAYVVAGAKSMMTYRRSGQRDGQPEPTAAGAAPAADSGSWGRSNSGSKPSASARPKSAGLIGSTTRSKPTAGAAPSGGGGPSGGGSNASGGVRPSSRGASRSGAPTYASGQAAAAPARPGPYRGSIG